MSRYMASQQGILCSLTLIAISSISNAVWNFEPATPYKHDKKNKNMLQSDGKYEATFFKPMEFSIKLVAIKSGWSVV